MASPHRILTSDIGGREPLRTARAGRTFKDTSWPTSFIERSQSYSKPTPQIASVVKWRMVHAGQLRPGATTSASP